MTKITNREMSLKIKAACGHQYDPAYIGSVRNGNRTSPDLLALIQKIEAGNKPTTPDNKEK